MASISIVDSDATFRRQAERLGFDQDIIDSLAAVGVTSLGHLAFAVVPPGGNASDDQIQAFFDSALPGRVLTIGEMSAFKRFIFESQTALVSHWKANTDPAADASARKLPPSERLARIENQKRRLAGLDLSRSNEVAHSVCDLFVGIMESDQLRYVHPSKCTTRAQEVSSSKPPKEIKLDQTSGSLVVKDQALDRDCNVGSELEILQAMTRRSLAMDCVGLVDYHIAQRWVSGLFSILQQQSAPGFNRITLTQQLRTDRQAFIRLAELCITGIRPLPDGTRPLDNRMVPTMATKDDSKKRKADDGEKAAHHPPKPHTKGKAKGLRTLVNCQKGSKNVRLQTKKVSDCVLHTTWMDVSMRRPSGLLT